MLLCLLLLSRAAFAGNLRVMKTGIGEGSFTVSSTGITDCNTVCSGTFTNGTPIILTASAPAGSTFLRWEGSVNSTTNPVTVTLTGDHRVRAVFGLLNPMGNPIPIIRDFSPLGLRAYFNANPYVNTPARFIAALPPAFRRNWILMTRSESLQTGTAFSPRLLLPDSTGKFVFTIGLTAHKSYPGSHPLAVEYMQWDPAEKNFRFHEVILGDIPAMETHTDLVTFPARNRAAIDFIKIDDSKCSRCHSTRNVLNETGSIGTTGDPIGLVQAKSKPNWDTYDSWAGMLAFNRDRIYQGSVEAAAFRYLFNPWNWEAMPVIREAMELLELQPPGIGINDSIKRVIGGPNDGRIIFRFDPLAERPVTREIFVGGLATVTTNYNFDGVAGSGGTTTVQRGGNYVTLRHSDIPTLNDEGRGVHLFDILGGINSVEPGGNFNAQRVADEVVRHRYITGSHAFDVRPIALAISRDLLRLDSMPARVVDNVAGVDINARADFFDPRNGAAPGRNIVQVYIDTRRRAFSLPRRKADLQRYNLSRWDDPYIYKPTPANGIFREYAGATSIPSGLNRMDSVRAEVFRRPNDRLNPDRTPMGGIYVDREDESPNIQRMALFRYFLEPLGVSVDRWSLGVRGRSRTYTFADVFNRYLTVFNRVWADSLTARPVFDPVLGRNLNPLDDADLIRAVNVTFNALPPPADIPTFVDVQRIFNKACIECHGGLEYPPYSNYNSGQRGFMNLSENDTVGGNRLQWSHNRAATYATAILTLVERSSEAYDATGMMPFGGPAISQTDIETIRRWIGGGSVLSTGDPHLVTVDGVAYDFQAAGEYVLLRGDFFELQARQRALATNGPLGPNPHTGLTTCVSVNTGVAMRIGNRRISYLPRLGRETDASGLELRLDGNLVMLPGTGLPFAPGSRIVPGGSPNAIRIETVGGTIISINASFWDYYQTWIMDIHVNRARAKMGLMGTIAAGSWLPSLPDGSSVGPMPADLGARFKILYGVFAKSWLVNDSTTLFDYAPGQSTTNYRLPNWPGGNSPQNCYIPAEPGEPQPPKGLTREEAEKLCAEVGDQRLREFCIQDLMVTGAQEFADNYRATDVIVRNHAPVPPKLTFPANDAKGLSLPIDFQWTAAVDADSDAITYRHLVWPTHEGPDTNLATPVGGKGGDGLRCGLIALLIGLAVWLLLWLLFRKKLSRVALALLFLLVLLVALLAYFLCGRAKGGSGLQQTVETLQGGQAYYWKVLVEDGKGGVTESETYRFEVR